MVYWISRLPAAPGVLAACLLVVINIALLSFIAVPGAYLHILDVKEQRQYLPGAFGIRLKNIALAIRHHGRLRAAPWSQCGETLRADGRMARATLADRRLVSRPCGFLNHLDDLNACWPIGGASSSRCAAPLTRIRPALETSLINTIYFVWVRPLRERFAGRELATTAPTQQQQRRSNPSFEYTRAWVSESGAFVA